jgi:AraC-like DNA-binding protein
MKREHYHWVTRLRTDRKVPGFPEPLSVAESEASSPVYRIVGATRVRESDSAVFQYTLSGRGILRVGELGLEVPAGCGFLCRVGDPAICYHYPDDGREPWRFVFFTFREFSGMVTGLNQNAGHVFRLPPESPMVRRMLSFRNHSGQILEVKAGEGAALVQFFMASLADLGRAEAKNDSEKDWVRRFRNKVNEMLFEPCNAEILAESIGISPEHLSRLFRRETGETPYRFLLRRKMDQACIMLKESGSTCRDVAASLGFEPGSHFARIFRRCIGVSPAEYRDRGIPGLSGVIRKTDDSVEANSCGEDGI